MVTFKTSPTWRLFQDAFRKKSYTANDFLKDEFISCPDCPSLQDEDASDWAEFSDHGRNFLSGSRKQLRETAEEDACPKGRKTGRKDVTGCC